MCVCRGWGGVTVGACACQEKASDSLELELQEIESPDNECWEPNSDALARAVHALNY